MRHSKAGGVIDFSEDKLIRLIACRIVGSRVPIRGKELKLLRTATGLSLNKFALRLQVTYGAIHLWERDEKKRLLLINEIAVRLLCAEEWGVKLDVHFSELVGDDRHEAVEVRVTNKKLTKPRAETRTELRPSYRGHRAVQVKIK